jgi:hypothetical protein
MPIDRTSLCELVGLKPNRLVRARRVVGGKYEPERSIIVVRGRLRPALSAQALQQVRVAGHDARMDDIVVGIGPAKMNGRTTRRLRPGLRRHAHPVIARHFRRAYSGPQILDSPGVLYLL